MSQSKVPMVALMLAMASTAWASTEADARRTLKVEAALLDHLGADGLDIDVVASGGDVKLLGTVPSQDAMDLAWTIARSVAGVDGVRNGVRVVDAAGSATAGDASARVENAILANRVRLTLVEEMGVDGVGISAKAANGTVTLEFGPELTPARRQAALELAKAVSGVVKVASVEKAR